VTEQHPPPVTAAELSAALRALLEAGREMQASMASRLRVGENDLLAMNEVVRTSDLGPVELGRRLGITSASATVLVSRLESAGHLERRRHDADGRRITLHPTPSALAGVLHALQPLLSALATIGDELEEGDRRVVLAYLDRVTAALHDYAADPATGDVRARPGAGRT